MSDCRIRPLLLTGFLKRMPFTRALSIRCESGFTPRLLRHWINGFVQLVTIGNGSSAQSQAPSRQHNPDGSIFGLQNAEWGGGRMG